MSGEARPRVLTIPPGVPFLPTLADSLLDGRLVPGFRWTGQPLALAAATIFVPTRRAARELRSVFVERLGGRSAILPTIRPLGDFDDDLALFEGEPTVLLDAAPPIDGMERLLTIAPLVRRWKERLPAHIAGMFAEDVVVPASAADSIWLARDLCAMMDEVETEGLDWSGLPGLVDRDLSAWWQVTLDFLSIVTSAWPAHLAESGRSNPAAHRMAAIDAETARLAHNPPAGPVVAAGSTGSIPATARLLSCVARLPGGAVVLPGLDLALDEAAWAAAGGLAKDPAAFGHPQYGLKRLLRTMEVGRAEVIELAQADPRLEARATIVSEALRPAETTDHWTEAVPIVTVAIQADALADVTLVEAANEREEALAIAVALRLAMREDGHVALVTADRELARRVSAELLRFGIVADDSGGRPLARTPGVVLLADVLRAAFTPGDPVPLLGVLKHPLLRLGRSGDEMRRLAELLELVALRGGTGRPDAASFTRQFEERATDLADDAHPPFWIGRLKADDFESLRRVAGEIEAAFAPLTGLRGKQCAGVSATADATVRVLETLVIDEHGGFAALYGGDAGERLAEFLRSLRSAVGPIDFAAEEWPDIVAALMAGETVKPSAGADSRVSIWGALEARLQSVDFLVIGGLNEGTWPQKAEPDRFMSRMMKAGMKLEPPERRIGLAAHDFVMAMGAPRVVLTRAARSGDAPAVASRWLQRLLALVGKEAAGAMRVRGATYLSWAASLDDGPDEDFAPRPNPKPPIDLRPKHFSVTEIETLRRDPYAIYARKVLGLRPLDPLLRDPGAAERGNLFHEVLHRYAEAMGQSRVPLPQKVLIGIAAQAFDEYALPPDVRAVWWPRFLAMAPEIILWEGERSAGVLSRHAEAGARSIEVGATGVTLSGRADRIDLRPGDLGDILDYKTGSSPSKRQAHVLLAPQLALEGALLARGAFRDLGHKSPADLAYVRLRPNGKVDEESILEIRGSIRSARDLSEDAWSRLDGLLTAYGDPDRGYLSRALPFREGDVDGDYDHLARVLEWSAGGGEADE